MQLIESTNQKITISINLKYVEFYEDNKFKDLFLFTSRKSRNDIVYLI